ncbi:hypothetical protein E2C01_073037 [Portunus trituberculatus]|uniref:Uncharacterized protein n=1 Tax=Portunus trituberculatus TaxID=210409 RepID=A0A5B7I9J3_PORTR|nr:hypothetical protein [Portunus trituberculatus]
MAKVDLAWEVVCSPVPVGTCLQQHWREQMEVGAGELVLKTALCINLPKSDLVPSQRKQYLGMVLNSVRALVFPSPERVRRFLLVVQSFLEDRVPTVSLWRSLLGHLASLERLVPGTWVRSWSLQGCLKNYRKAVSDSPWWWVPPSQWSLADLS